MPTIKERFRHVSGDQKTRTIGFLVEGAKTDQDALNYAERNTYASWDLMPRENLTVTEVSKPSYKTGPADPGTGDPDFLPDEYADETQADGTYYVEARYARNSTERADPQTNKAVTPGDSTTHKDSYAFEASLETRREVFFEASKRIKVDAATGFSPINRDGINYQGVEKGLEGIDIARPTKSFSLTYYPEDGKIDLSVEESLVNAVGTVHSGAAVFWGYQNGEVLCTGVTGQGRNTSDWQITARFQVQRNSAPTIAPGISLGTVDGWDYIDVEYVRAEDTDGDGKKTVTQKIRQATVWQVYDRLDFNAIFGALQ